MTSRTEFFSNRPVPEALYQSASLLVQNCPYNDWESNQAWLRGHIAEIGLFILPLKCEGGVFDWTRLEYVRDESCDYTINLRFNKREYASGKADHRILEMVMDRLKEKEVEITWNQPKTKVLVEFGIEDPYFDPVDPESKKQLNDTLGIPKLIEEFLAPVTTRIKVSNPPHRRITRSATDSEVVPRLRYRVFLSFMSVTCPSPAVAEKLIALDPITSHAPYTISFKVDPNGIHVDSCCTLGIKLADKDKEKLVDPFCFVVTRLFKSAYPGKHFFTPLSQTSFGGVYTVTASSIDLAHFLTQLPTFFGNQFYFLSSPPVAPFLPNSRQSSLLKTLQSYIETMSTTLMAGDIFSLAAARRSAIEILHKLATTAELFKIGGSKLTEATGRLGRVERDLIKMMDSEMDLNLETVTSLCTRLQKSMAELRDVEVALARVEKWYRATKENDRKKKKEEEAKATVKARQEQSVAAVPSGLASEGGQLPTSHQVQDIASIMPDLLISHEAEESTPSRAIEIDGAIQSEPSETVKVVPAKRALRDDEDDSALPVRPYKQPNSSHFEVLLAQPTHEVNLLLESAPFLPVTPQQAISAGDMEVL